MSPNTLIDPSEVRVIWTERLLRQARDAYELGKLWRVGPFWGGPEPRLHTGPQSTCARCEWARLHFNLAHHIRVRQEHKV